MKLTLGFSPCPNDCFMFDALVHKRIDTKGIDFEIVMKDVESLNKKAFQNKLDVTKLSYHAFIYLTKQYILLNSGSALGYNCGPLLVCDSKKKNLKIDEYTRIAIPGRYTTANFLLSLAYPAATNREEYVFSDIEGAVLSGAADAGLLIHENRFTYEQRGLKKIMDMGEFWEELIQAPIPLGGIVMQRTHDKELIKTVDLLIKESIEYAFKNPDASMDFVKQHAQEMEEEVVVKHIDLYVNEFSVQLGETGIKAVELMFGKAIEKHLIENYKHPLVNEL
jgi:1,4-dihydroxy-6-naphthoate synthase